MALYDAFISYSHAKDKPIAAALQSVVQKLGNPWYRRRALRVFRDDTSLSATPQLWPTIEQALGESRYLILLASPEAAASHWVGKEVPYWLEAKRADTLLIGSRLNQVADAADAGPCAEESARRKLIVGPLVRVDALFVGQYHQEKGQLVADDVRHAIEEGHEIVEQGF
jgi:MTH538 TIR-like domain (DUF1863)